MATHRVIVEENAEKPGLRWTPEKALLEIKRIGPRSANLPTAAQIQELEDMARTHPWTWCYIDSARPGQEAS